MLSIVLVAALSFNYFCNSQSCLRKSSLIASPLLDTKLETGKIAVIETWNELNCIQRCFRVKGCDGANTKIKSKDSSICEMLSSKSSSGQTKFVSEKGWKYYNLKPQSVCDKSATDSCSAKQQCVADPHQPDGFLCADLPNIAYLKPTMQSSNFDGIGTSSKAVDGNRNGIYSLQSCTHTSGYTFSEWWRVDFGKEANVKSVAITNRAGCCTERLGKFDILVGSNGVNDGSSNSACQNNLSMTSSGTKLFKCKDIVVGRYLYVKSHLQTALTLCEVEVFGVLPASNVA